MKHGGGHFSYGIADNLNDPKYKYWSNPFISIFLCIYFGSILGVCYLYFLQISLSYYLLFYENIDINGGKGKESYLLCIH